ncbi:MAG: hypothetical protein AAGC44_05365 [Planctomycetota bacterium]
MALGLTGQTEAPDIEPPNLTPPEADGGRERAAPSVFCSTPRSVGHRRRLNPFTKVALLEALVLILLGAFWMLAFCWPQVIDAVRRGSVFAPVEQLEPAESPSATDGPASQGTGSTHPPDPNPPAAGGRPDGSGGLSPSQRGGRDRRL